MLAFHAPRASSLSWFPRNALSSKRKRAHDFRCKQRYSPGLVSQPITCRPLDRLLAALDDPAVIQGIATALFGLGAGIAFLVWTEKQGDRGVQRENLQPCVVCKGQKRLECIRCGGSGKNPTDASEQCSFCDGVGTTMCSNCAGRGTQPRYLDRFSPEDFMD
ncbi:hypothetical protein GAYE_SCF28MG4780 [Galdieria yellowstonensis]|uniref:Uncharacterized protein n=1 Tax=Galdieria yellowstonensis TaxID=3028027 RepID=A0AAV9IHM0_9RHOD|nr:hypothetical protein GAYE_SCF28MG4780 [Galdieria yellowstonensis]